MGLCAPLPPGWREHVQEHEQEPGIAFRFVCVVVLLCVCSATTAGLWTLQSCMCLWVCVATTAGLLRSRHSVANCTGSSRVQLQVSGVLRQPAGNKVMWLCQTLPAPPCLTLTSRPPAPPACALLTCDALPLTTAARNKRLQERSDWRGAAGAPARQLLQGAHPQAAPGAAAAQESRAEVAASAYRCCTGRRRDGPHRALSSHAVLRRGWRSAGGGARLHELKGCCRSGPCWCAWSVSSCTAHCTANCLYWALQVAQSTGLHCTPVVWSPGCVLGLGLVLNRLGLICPLGGCSFRCNHKLQALVYVC